MSSEIPKTMKAARVLKFGETCAGLAAVPDDRLYLNCP